jgi:hypothetical protein
MNIEDLSEDQLRELDLIGSARVNLGTLPIGDTNQTAGVLLMTSKRMR